jgi:hypothetical protein
MPSFGQKHLGAAATTTVIIVERNGELRASEINEYSQLELAKKCKFKTSSGFEVRAEWAYSGSGSDVDKFVVELWAREHGTAGQENKYEFPPPVDTILFFGACVLVAKDATPQHNVIPLTLEKWDKMYTFLFGGFDTLANCDDDDDDDYEEDELDSVPSSNKTKDGYLKDGFVVDEGDETTTTDDDTDYDEDDDDDDDDDDDETTSSDNDAYDDSDKDSDKDSDSDNDTGTGTGTGTDNTGMKKPAARKASQKKNTVVKKKGGARDELAVPSFELVEETYEYFDD